MSLLTIILVIVVVGVALWAINGYLPMDAKVKQILNITVILILIVWLLRATGIWAAIARVTF